METDTKTAQTKITYATMTADRMEDLHRELDTAIERVKSTFGRSYPLVIGGRPMAAERPSPRLGEHTIEILREIGETEGTVQYGGSRR